MLRLVQHEKNYFFCGVAGGLAGFAGCDLVCDGLRPCKTELGPARRDAKMESVIEVTMKMMADQVVAFDRAVAAPRGPNAVWLPMPPKAAAMSPLLPLCSNTTMMRKKQTMMWTMVMSVISMWVLNTCFSERNLVCQYLCYNVFIDLGALSW